MEDRRRSRGRGEEEYQHNGHKCPFGCNDHVTAVAAGQSQRYYSGVGIFNWYYLSSPPQSLRPPVVHLELGGLIYQWLRLRFGFDPPAIFTHISITTPIVSALKNYYCVFHKEPTVRLASREASRTSCEGGKMLHRRPRGTVKAPLSALHFS